VGLPRRSPIRQASTSQAVPGGHQMLGHTITAILAGQCPGRTRGYPSHFELRNSWNGAPWTAWDTRRALKTGSGWTCAHELFHGTQYAMTWDLAGYASLDDFPLSWIEARVLMEEWL